MTDTVLLDLRNERGRFFMKMRMPGEDYRTLEVIARLDGITMEELLHRAIQEYAAKIVVERAS